MLLEIKFYILNLRIFLPIFCCSLEILYLQYPFFFEKSTLFCLLRPYSDIIDISFVRTKPKLLNLSYKALYHLPFAHTYYLPLLFSIHTLHFCGIYLPSGLEHTLYSGSQTCYPFFLEHNSLNLFGYFLLSFRY